MKVNFSENTYAIILYRYLWKKPNCIGKQSFSIKKMSLRKNHPAKTNDVVEHR